MSRYLNPVLAYLLTGVTREYVFLSEIWRLTTKQLLTNANYAAATAAGQMFGVMGDENAQAHVTETFENIGM